MLARAELGEQLVAEDHQQPAKMVVAAAGAHAPVAVSPGVHLDKLTSAGGKQRSGQARVAELGPQQPRHHRALLVVPADPQRNGLAEHPGGHRRGCGDDSRPGVGGVSLGGLQRMLQRRVGNAIHGHRRAREVRQNRYGP